jgi:hypothetical protein
VGVWGSGEELETSQKPEVVGGQEAVRLGPHLPQTAWTNETPSPQQTEPRLSVVLLIEGAATVGGSRQESGRGVVDVVHHFNCLHMVGCD